MQILQRKKMVKGTVIEIESAGKATDLSVDSSANTRHACILVAEDTDSNFDLLEAILGKDHRLIRAHDGMEAVTIFDEVKPDLDPDGYQDAESGRTGSYENHP